MRSPTRAALSSLCACSHCAAAPCSCPSAACCKVSSEDRRPRAACACLRSSASSVCWVRCWSCSEASDCLRVSTSVLRPSSADFWVSCCCWIDAKAWASAAMSNPVRSAPSCSRRRSASRICRSRCSMRVRSTSPARVASACALLCASQRCCQSDSVPSASRQAFWRSPSSACKRDSCGSASATDARSTSSFCWSTLMWAPISASAECASSRARCRRCASSRWWAICCSTRARSAPTRYTAACAPFKASFAVSRRPRPVSSSRSASRCSATHCSRRVCSCARVSRRPCSLASSVRNSSAFHSASLTRRSAWIAVYCSACLACRARCCSCLPTSSRRSLRRSRFSRVWRMRVSVSLRRSLYLEMPAASSRYTRRSSGRASMIWLIMPCSMIE